MITHDFVGATTIARDSIGATTIALDSIGATTIALGSIGATTITLDYSLFCRVRGLITLDFVGHVVFHRGTLCRPTLAQRRSGA